jgi:4-amino-4-deoxy-L-arabinose transferase-like glycosyltransferase
MALFFCGVILTTLGDYGITFDEAVYYRAGLSYAHWLKSPSWDKIDSFWNPNHEHPPLVKLLGGLTHVLFQETLPILSHLSAFRAATLFFVLLGTYFLILFAAVFVSYPLALWTAASFLLLPRVFFHAQLGAMDYPLACLWLGVVYASWKGMKNPKWIWAASVLLGLALLTKANAFLLYIPVLGLWIFTYLDDRRRGLYPPGYKAGREKRSPFLSLALLLFIPPAMFIGFWPWIWPDPVSRIAEFLAFHWRHPLVYVYYLGRQVPLASWHYPFVLTFFTIPLVILFPLGVGLFSIISRPDRSRVYLLFNCLFPLLLIANPWVPKYDGVRLFLPAFPFLCILAGMGLHQLILWSRKVRGGKAFLPLYLLLFSMTIYSAVIRIHPYQSSYYNELIGGIDGAVKRGFEAEFWGNAQRGVLPWFNAHPRHAYWVYMADLEPKLLWGFDLYKEDGLLDPAVRFGNKDNSDFLVLLIRPGFFSPQMWDYYKNQEPVFSVRLSQTPLVNIYRLRPTDNPTPFSHPDRQSLLFSMP